MKTLKASAKTFKIKRNFAFQHDNDQKHTSKSPKEWLQQNKIKGMEWPRPESRSKSNTKKSVR